MNELKLCDFAELARMLKYIDRYDSDEILATIKQEGKQEMKKAEKSFEEVNKKLEEIEGEQVEL